MKKIICLVLMCFCLTSCKASYNDTVNMLDKMEAILKEDQIFDEYKIIGKNVYNDQITNYSFIKKQDSYFAHVNEKEYLILKNNSNYNIYFNDTTNKQLFVTTSDIDSILSYIFDDVDMTYSLKESYYSISNYLRNNLNKCNSGEKTVNCKVEKNFYKKLNFELTILGDNNKRINSYRLNNGKLIYLSSKYVSQSLNIMTEFNYEYKNIDIKKINYNEYKIVP